MHLALPPARRSLPQVWLDGGDAIGHSSAGPGVSCDRTFESRGRLAHAASDRPARTRGSRPVVGHRRGRAPIDRHRGGRSPRWRNVPSAGKSRTDPSYTLERGEGEFPRVATLDPPLNPRGETTTGLAIQRLAGLGHPRASGPSVVRALSLRIDRNSADDPGGIRNEP